MKKISKILSRVAFATLFVHIFAGSAFAADILNEAFNISGTDAVSSNYNGWTITRCWGGNGSIRLGASSGDKGQIISPALSSLSGNATLTFEVKRYSTDTGSIGISIAEGAGSVSGDVSVASSSISADNWTSKTVTITGGSSSTKIKFLMTNKRMYLKNVRIVSVSSSGYTVTYNSNGGSGTMTDPNSPYASGATVTLLSNTFTAPSGKVWSSWLVKDSSNNTVSVSNNQFTMPSSNVTVTAQWADATTYTVSYNANGGSGTVTDSNSPYAEGANVTVVNNKFSKTGYGFVKWNTQADGLGLDYLPGATISGINANTTLYAQWEALTYDFTSISGINDWGSSYDEHAVTYSDATVVFESAAKQTQTITNQPVTKGGDVELKLTDGSTMSKVSFFCTQWTTKEQTITLNYSTNGGTSYSVFDPDVTSSTFTITKDNLPDGTNAVKITFSSTSNQVGILGATIVKISNPTISVEPSSLSGFTYIAGNGPSSTQDLAITGSHLSSGITATVTSGNSYYELSADEQNWSSALNLAAAGDLIAVRLKAGLTQGNYEGTITLSSTGATDVFVSLSGLVTGQTYAISVDDDVTGGSIEADLASAEEGATVTLTATPDAAYTFGTWSVFEDDLTTPVTVTNNQFIMPACEVYVTATFNAKPTYAITCVASPSAGGTIVANNNAYEGEAVTVSYEANPGYGLSSIVITKTSDGSATGITPTASGDDYTFTMPGYAVTATATFVPFVSWNLGIASYDTITDTDVVTWSSNFATMENSSKSGGTSASNYLGGDSNNRSSSRMYNGNTLTITPSYGYAITYVVFTATSDSYASALQNSVWDNATASANGTVVTVSPSTGSSAISAVIGGTCGFTEVKVYYEEYEAPDTAPVWSSLPNNEVATVGTEYTFTPATYVTGHPVPSITLKSSTADKLLYSYSEGTLHFTPNVAGSVEFTFTATNTVDSVDGVLTITVNPAASVSVPVLAVDEANTTSNSALVSWSDTGVASYTLQLASDNEFSDGSGEATVIENAATSSSAPTGWSYNIATDKSSSYLVLFSGNYIITKAFDASACSDLSLSLQMRTYGGTGDPSVEVSYSTDGGSTWSGSLGILSAINTSFAPISLDISAADGNSSVLVRISSTSTSSSVGVGIKNISITGTISGNGSIISESIVKSNSFTFKGLSAGTTYYARVKGSETWSNTVNFTTESETPTTTNLSISGAAKYNGRYWTTFYDAGKGYKLPAGAQAFKLASDNKLYLLGDSGLVIPAGTAVVIVSDKTSLVLTETSATFNVTDNILVGAASDVTVTDGKVDNKTPHVLGIVGSPAAIGFYKFSGSSIPGGKAYVLVNE